MALSEKDLHVGRFYGKARQRAMRKNVPFTITLEYLRSIAPDNCPVFGHKFKWGMSGLGYGKTTGDSPSIDRIVPELGYIPGNVVFISHNANRIKSNATETELYAVADWLHDARKIVLNAQQKQLASVSNGTNKEVEGMSQSGTVSTTGIGEDNNNTYHHCGADGGKDVNHSAQESSGNSVGTGNQEVVTLEAFTRIENNGESELEIVRLDFGRKYLSDKS